VQQQVEDSASASRVPSTNQVPMPRSAPALSPTRAGPPARLATDVPASSPAGPVPATAPDAPGSPCPGSAPCTTSEAPEEAALPVVPDLQRDGPPPSVAVPSTTATAPIADSAPLQQQSSAPSPEVLQHRTRLQGGIRKPKLFTDETVRYGNLAISSEPLNLQEALSPPYWKHVMDDEFRALLCNKI
jgi:hypothetical protein